MRTRCIDRMAFVACLLLATATAHAQSNTLTGVDVASSGMNGVQIELTLTDRAPSPSVFTVTEPPRISVDLPDTVLDVSERYRRVEQGPVDAVAIAEGDSRTRVVIELSEMADYTVNRRGNQIMIGVGDTGAAASPVATTPSTATSAAAPSSASGRASNRSSSPTIAGPQVRNIDFRRGENGAGRVELMLQGVDRAIDVDERNGKVIANLPGVALPAELERRLDVTDFATPVRTIDAVQRGGDTRVEITPMAGADYEQVAYQTGDRFYIELAPREEPETAEQETQGPQYTGERISLSFQSIEVRAVLQIIADVADVNMVVSDSVSGTMALRLEDVPWDQALDIILQAKGLGMRKVNNVITVAPLAEIAAREQAELEARQATENLAPLRSEIIQINYARASEFAQLIRSSDNAVSLLSDRGRISVDERTNSLIVSETREVISQIRSLINTLDIPIRQVLIESRIVIANRDFSRNLGISQSSTDNGSFESSSDGNYLTETGYAVDLPAADATSVFNTSILGDTFQLNLALSAMEMENRGEIISSPRVITADGQEASIEQGVEIPYQEGGTGGLQTATVEFKEAVLGLTVTPSITPDDRVIMNLDITQDSVGEFVPTQGGGQVPSINTRNLQTQVLVDDGETVVLGGVFEQENRDERDRVPVLGELPLIGALFRGSARTRNKRELLVFITPNILKESLSLDR